MTFQSDTNSPSSHALLSCTDGLAVMWRDFLLLVGRVMVGLVFVVYGWDHILDMPKWAATFPGRGLAPWMAYIAAPAEILGGLFLIVGFATRYTVLVLLFFMIVAAFSSHAFWSVPPAQRGNQGAHFWKNITIIGGLVVLFVSAGGRISLDRILFRNKG